MVDDLQAKRRDHARRLANLCGKQLRGQYSTRMSIVADRAFRVKVEQLRTTLQNRAAGERSVCLSDVIRYCVNVLYWDLMGEAEPTKEPEGSKNG